MSNLPVEPVVLGEKQREVLAIDSSTIARWRAKAGMELLGKGFHHRAGKAILRQHHRSSYNCSLYFWGTSRVGASSEIWRQL